MGGLASTIVGGFLATLIVYCRERTELEAELNFGHEFEVAQDYMEQIEQFKKARKGSIKC